MRFYRVHERTHDLSSLGFEFFATKAEAERDLRACKAADGDNDDSEMEAVDVEPTRAGILAALNKYASHAENG